MKSLGRIIATILWSGELIGPRLGLCLELSFGVINKHNLTWWYPLRSETKRYLQDIRFDEEDFLKLSCCFFMSSLFIKLFKHTYPDGNINYDRTVRGMFSLIGRRINSVRIVGVADFDYGLTLLYLDFFKHVNLYVQLYLKCLKKKMGDYAGFAKRYFRANISSKSYSSWFDFDYT